jgi:hypothetical protein
MLKWAGRAIAALALLIAVPALAAADKPLVIESGQIKQLPSATTLQTRAATTANASINMPHGVAPTSPVDGDCWTTTGSVYCRVNGMTKNLSAPAFGDISGTPVPSAPGGRLTLTSNTPVMINDATAATAIYYAPYINAFYPVYDGSNWSMRAIGQLTMTLDSTNQPTQQVFDLFVWNNAGTDSIGAGPAWNNNSTVTITIANPAIITWTGHNLEEGEPVIFTTTGSLPSAIMAGTIYYVSRSPTANTFAIATTVANASAGTQVSTATESQSGTHTGTNHTGGIGRGTGAGTTELQLLNGIWTNKNSITLTNGAGAGTVVAANQATYVGSFYTTAAGQTGMQFNPAAASGGSNTILALWNAYNRVLVTSMSRDNHANWTYTSATWRPMDNSVSDRVTYLDGLAQSFAQTFGGVSAGTNGSSITAIGQNWNSTAATPTVIGSSNVASGGWLSVNTFILPNLGYNYVSGMEAVTTGASGNYGGSPGFGVVGINLEMHLPLMLAVALPGRRRRPANDNGRQQLKRAA